MVPVDLSSVGVCRDDNKERDNKIYENYTNICVCASRNYHKEEIAKNKRPYNKFSGSMLVHLKWVNVYVGITRKGLGNIWEEIQDLG